MDNLTPSQRSRAMKAVKSTNSSAELAVRGLSRELGAPGYRLHRRDIPGTPDIAYLGKHLAIFVHGCFWHGHTCKAGAKVAKTNADYWRKKIARNMARDARNLDALATQGWRTLVVWECEVRDTALIRRKLDAFLHQTDA
jgi:DNA mismatch endonuclease (patch repair protein)